MATPVIIEAAINGATSKAVNPHVPITAEEVAADALAVFAAGATLVHTHAATVRGEPAVVAQQYLDAFAPVWARRPGALIYPTVNYGRGGVDLEHLVLLAAEGLRVGVLDPGSVNLGGLDPDGVPVGRFVYANPFDSLTTNIALHAQHHLGISLAVYEPGFLRTVLAYERAGRLPAGSMVKLYFCTERGLTGAPFGLPPTRTALDAYLEVLDGSALPWAASIAGGDLGRSDLAPAVLERGGHLHVGLEFYAGGRTPSNVELVAEAVALCAAAGRPVATHDEAVAILGLPAR